MHTKFTVPFVLIGLGLSMSASYAGPCAEHIVRMQTRIDAALAARAAAGPTGKETGFAGMSEQPTPRSMAAAEERLGELSAGTVAAVREAMATARAADAAGDYDSCESALVRVQRLIGS